MAKVNHCQFTKVPLKGARLENRQAFSGKLEVKGWIWPEKKNPTRNGLTMFIFCMETSNLS